MSEVWQRILIAAFLSISGCLVTYALTTSSKNTLERSPNEEPVALIISSENEVQRRLSERLVWRKIFDNQYLYAGEAIRTAVSSTATLEFLAQKTIVQLDPETVVQIERNGGNVNLDFLKGNLFIRSEAAKDTLTLSSGGKTLAIQNAELSVSKADVNSNIQVEVSKGEVKGTEQEQQRIEIVNPVPRQVLYVNPGENRSVAIEWKEIPRSYIVSIELGESPQRLSKVTDVQIVENQRTINLPLKTGRYYFKISAVDVDGKLPPLASFTRRIELRPKLSPITLEPANGSKVQVASDKSEIEFRWANPGQLENLVVEYARSPDLRVDHGSLRLKNELSSRIPIRWNNGEIFWRVSGVVPGTRDTVSSKITKFSLQTGVVIAPPIAVATPAPTPVSTPSPTPVAQASPSPSPSPSATPQVAQPAPTAKPKIAAPLVDEAVEKEGIVGKNDGTAKVNWKPVAEAKQYQVQVLDSQGQVIQTTKVGTTSVNLSNLKTGDYKVTLNSIDRAGEVGSASREILLKIPEYSSVRAPKIKSMTVK